MLLPEKRRNEIFQETNILLQMALPLEIDEKNASSQEMYNE